MGQARSIPRAVNPGRSRITRQRDRQAARGAPAARPEGPWKPAAGEGTAESVCRLGLMHSASGGTQKSEKGPPRRRQRATWPSLQELLPLPRKARGPGCLEILLCPRSSVPALFFFLIHETHPLRTMLRNRNISPLPVTAGSPGPPLPVTAGGWAVFRWRCCWQGLSRPGLRCPSP